MTNSWSFSNYSIALNCLQKYKLVVVDKIPSGLDESGDVQFGTALHAGLQALLEGDDGEQTFKLFWDSFENATLNYSRFKHSELKELGLNFLAKWERLHRKHYIPQATEDRLFSEYKGIKLEGTPDFIGKYKERPSLRDFKTSGYNYHGSKADVSLQLYLYSYLAKKELDFHPETVGYDVFNKGTGSIQNQTIDFKEADMYRHLDQMVEYLELVDRGKYPKNSGACIQGSIVCPFIERCWKR